MSEWPTYWVADPLNYRYSDDLSFQIPWNSLINNPIVGKLTACPPKELTNQVNEDATRALVFVRALVQRMVAKCCLVVVPKVVKNLQHNKMLPKLHRLTEKKDYQEVLKHGKMYQGQYFGLAHVAHEGPLKIGIIVSNKVSKRAVERNRIRRIVRRVARTFLETTTEGYRFVFLAKKSAERAESRNLLTDTTSLLNKYAKNIN